MPPEAKLGPDTTTTTAVAGKKLGSELKVFGLLHFSHAHEISTFRLLSRLGNESSLRYFESWEKKLENDDVRLDFSSHR